MRGNRRSKRSGSNPASSSIPYSNIFNGNSTNSSSHHDDDDDYVGVPPLVLKLLGPFATLLLSNDFGNAEELQNRLRIFSLVIIGISTFFWCWAVKNSLSLQKSTGGFDLGVFSFLGTSISSLFLLRSALGEKCYDRNQRFGCCGKRKKKVEDVNDDDDQPEMDVYGINKRGRDGYAISHSPPGKILRIFTPMTHLAVAANYMLGILFAFTAGTKVYIYFATYCFIFAILWLIVTFAGWVLVTVYREAVRRSYGEIVLNGPPRPSCWRQCLIALTNRSTGRYDSVGMNDYVDDEEDDIDDELRALYEGTTYTNVTGGYTNA